jgi:hypothetical protein
MTIGIVVVACLAACDPGAPWVNSPLVDDLQEFVHDHRPHSALTVDATKPAWNGYLLAVACPCGVVFERWVTQEDADADLVRIARLN